MQQSHDTQKSFFLQSHDCLTTYTGYSQFQHDLPRLLEAGQKIDELINLTRVIGFVEPITNSYSPASEVEIVGCNYRETLKCKGLISRNRGLLRVLVDRYNLTNNTLDKEVYITESLTGMVKWLRDNLNTTRLETSEYLVDSEISTHDVCHQDIEALTYLDDSFDLVICSEVFEHLANLGQALRETRRVLRDGGRLLATCPMAFGQYESIVKGTRDPATGEFVFAYGKEYHGDPLRPLGGSIVYQIPGWDILDMLLSAGFSAAYVHHVLSWKNAIYANDLPGVLVVEAVC